MQMTEIEKMVWLFSSASYIISAQGPVMIFFVILKGFARVWSFLGSTVLNEPLLIKCSSRHCPHLLNYRGLFKKKKNREIKWQLSDAEKSVYSLPASHI